MMWHPFKGAFRVGEITGTEWDDVNIGFYSWAGGLNTRAAAYGSFAFGDGTNVTSVLGAGFGSSNQISGTAGFSTGAGNFCAGFSCVALGFTNRAGGQGSVAIGERTIAEGSRSVALGYRATSCNTISFSTPGADMTCPDGGGSRSGSFTWADNSTTSYIGARADNSFNVRAAGGVVFYTNFALTAGVFMNAGASSWNAVSDSTRKEHIVALDPEALLRRLADLPVSTWRYRAEEDRSVRHIGPMAQDWQRHVAGPLGLNADETTINQGDFDGVNLAGVIALEARTRAQAAEIEALRAEVAALRAEAAAVAEARTAVEARMARIEAALALGGAAGETRIAGMHGTEVRP